MRFPQVEVAWHDLAGRQVVTREDYESMAEEARAQAFTIAGVQSEDAIEKVRDALADDVRRGGTLREFRVAVEQALGASALAPHAVEGIYRNAVGTSYLRGLDAVLGRPMVEDEFPFRLTEGVEDSRQTPLCRICNRSGLNGTGVYHKDDPEYDRTRPMRHWQCRCAVIPLNVEGAASRGVKYAQEWLRLGYPPGPPPRVPRVPVNMPEGWVRMSLEGTAHAPKGGATVAGDFYPGGEFIPKEAMAQATPEERAAVAPELEKPAAHSGHLPPDFHRDKMRGKYQAIPEMAMTYKYPLGKELLTALGRYTMVNGPWKTINRHLRTGSALSEKAAKMCDQIHQVMKHLKPFEKPLTVWRGLRLKQADEAELVGKMRAAAESGQPIEMQGFISTSRDPSVSGYFTRTRGMYFEIRARKGVYMESITTSPGEDELLLDHGSRFKVHAVIEAKVNGITSTVIQLDHLLDDAEPAAPQPEQPARLSLEAREGAEFAQPWERFTMTEPGEVVFTGTRRAGVSLSHYDPDEPRDRTGKWTAGGGGRQAAKTPEEKARRKEELRAARKGFREAMRSVFGVDSAAEADDVTIEQAGRELHIEYYPHDKSAFIEFTQARVSDPSAKQHERGTAWDTTAGALQAGTVDVLHKFTDLLGKLAKAGVGVHYETTDTRRRRLYAKALTAAGFVEVKSNDPEQSQWRPATRAV